MEEEEKKIVEQLKDFNGKFASKQKLLNGLT